MLFTAPIQLLLLALTATQSSASPVAAPASDLASRDFTEAAVSEAGVEKRSYQKSCNSCTISPSYGNPVLKCFCHKPGSSSVWTSLSLNSCIANRNGVIKWAKNGNFGHSCNGIMFAGRGISHSVQAGCKAPGSDTYMYSDLNMDGHIHNRNGKLAC